MKVIQGTPDILRHILYHKDKVSDFALSIKTKINSASEF